MAKEIKQWITVNHIHIPIFEGETVKDAVDRMKKGARKGKDTRPISKESYEKKAKAADKAYKSIGEHSERLLKANKKIKEGDNSPEAKKEFMNAERTLKEAGQRFQKRSAEHQEAVKHPKYTSIKVKKGEKKELPKNIDHVQSKSSHTLANDLKSKGFELDSSDRHTIENSNRNDYKVTLFDKNKNEYEGTFNRYNDGGTEIVNITKKSTSSKKEDIENNRKVLRQYQEWEKSSRQKLEEFENTSKYRLNKWNENDEEKRKIDLQHKELQDAVNKNHEEAQKLIKKLQDEGALPGYSQPGDDGALGRGHILDSTIKADPRYETLRNSLKYKKHNADDMLRSIMYAEEEGRTSFDKMVHDFYGGDRRDYTERTAHYKNKPGEEGYGTFGEFLTDYKKAMREVGWKVTSSKNEDSHRRGYRTARGGYQSASHTQARTLTFEKIPEKAVKPKTTKSWQDKDAEIKAKQIANAEAQKAERNSVRHYGPEIEDEQFRKDALAEMRRYKSNWDFYSAKERQNISPNGIKELDARIKEIEDYEKNLKKRK